MKLTLPTSRSFFICLLVLSTWSCCYSQDASSTSPSATSSTAPSATPSATPSTSPSATSAATSSSATPSATSSASHAGEEEARPAFKECRAKGNTSDECISEAYRNTPFSKCVESGECWRLPDNVLADREHIEYEGYDGFYNNFAHPELGAIDSPLVRVLPPAYSDGVYQPRKGPNPLEISDATMSGFTGLGSFRNRTALLVFFGQQVVEEVLDAQRPGCPPEYFNVKIPKGHEFSHNLSDFEMPFLRSRYSMRTGFSPNNPRQQLNEITAYIDGTLMYGVGKAWADTLREFEGGRMAHSKEDLEKGLYVPILNTIRLPMANPPPPADHYHKNVDRFWRLGNPRGNENPFLLTMGILWFRWHNYLAYQFQAAHPQWSDEKVFNEARKWVIATHQNIVLYEWLPSWLGEENYRRHVESGGEYRYKPDVDPGIAAVFQSAAMRFGHTLVPPAVYRRSANCTFLPIPSLVQIDGHRPLQNSTRTCNSYWNGQDVVRQGYDELILGMSAQIAEREDNIITQDLRGRVFGPLEFSRRDLMAVNIQRGRDHGLPDYNTAREHFHVEIPGLEEKRYRLNSFDEFKLVNPFLFGDTDEGRGLLERFRTVYKNEIDNIDIWVGGILETSWNCTTQNIDANGQCEYAGPGPLFGAIIGDQFRRIRDGDRFWFENYELNRLFTGEEVEVIRKIRLRDIIVSISSIPNDTSVLQENPFFWLAEDDSNTCVQTEQLNHTEIEPCRELNHFDYFNGSEESFILTFLFSGLLALATVGQMRFMARRRQRSIHMQRMKVAKSSMKKKGLEDAITVKEWCCRKEQSRRCCISLRPQKRILVKTPLNKVLRTIDLAVEKSVLLKVSADRQRRFLMLHLPQEYDLVLKFDDVHGRDAFIQRLESFLGEAGVGRQRLELPEKEILESAFTKHDRQQLLEKFFRVVFAQAFNIDYEKDRDVVNLKTEEFKQVTSCELTKTEFAEALSMKIGSTFVEKMFSLVDNDNTGYISFKEFLDMTVIFAKGTPDERMKIMFDMYDIEKKGKMTRDEFRDMLSSLLELANERIDNEKTENLINSLFKSANLEDKQEITFEDFKYLLSSQSDVINYAGLSFEGTGVQLPKSAQRLNAPSRARKTIVAAYNKPRPVVQDQSGEESKVDVSSEARKFEKDPQRQRIIALTRFIQNYRYHIFWCSLYTLVLFGVFAERAYFYSVEREFAGLRRIAGYGVTVTRGAASAMMFTYSCLLVTMCRNTITFLRETFLHRYIPFDASVTLHKYIAAWAFLFSVMHTIGHSINFYHISAQTADDTGCLFRDYFHATHELPKFHYWCFQTITGFTGVLLLVVMVVMYVFAIEHSRRHLFTAFWFTHQMYVVFYILMFLHGMGRLVQPPFFYYFFLGPMVLFILDKLVSISRKKVEIPVIRAELLPSDVICLEFVRPPHFDYLSGQWLRIASLVQNSTEYHPFTISSAPHEKYLSLHIRAVGPWTTNLRRMYDPDVLGGHSYPKVYLDGPYGEGHQDWYKFDVAVLVGGGIGVTPFASILKDIVHKSSSNIKFPCKKVYFLWVTRSQKQFEWMADIIREVEENDGKDLVSTNIYITQFYHEFDLRTTMLYICETHFQKISGRSLLTGLRAKTHFGRPNIANFLYSLTFEHPEVSKFGVFSCGPPQMTLSVERACSDRNSTSEDGAIFVHHYENF